MKLEWKKLEKHQPTFTSQELDQLKAMRLGYRGGCTALEYAALDLLNSKKLSKLLKIIDYID